MQSLATQILKKTQRSALDQAVLDQFARLADKRAKEEDARIKAEYLAKSTKQQN